MDEEINLREVIEVLLAGKWIIVGLVVLAVAAAGIVSTILPTTYEAATTIMVQNPPSSQQAEGDNPFLSMLSQYPVMTAEASMEQITCPAVLNKVIERLDLGSDYSASQLKKAISAESMNNTNLLKIKMSGEDPTLVADILNAVADEFVIFISEKSRQSFAASTKFLASSLKAEQDKISKASEEYKDFLAQPESVNELEQEIEAKLFIITEFKKLLVENTVEINGVTAQLAQAEADLEETPQVIEIKKTLSDDYYLQGGLQGTGPGGSPVGMGITSEELNPVYAILAESRSELRQQLAMLTAQQSELQAEIERNQSGLLGLQSTLAEKRLLDDQLSENVKLLRQNYELIAKKYEEARLGESAQIGQTSISVISRAIAPESPTGPRKMLNMAIAAVLGCMIGVFWVFFADFWRKSETQ
ncbi:MAG TPA: Wzz/FepE/Etk N-terminal domain-containing protein [Clostridia bacterium]|nr:Wzz/FepE/Etk N-terminal domain-containing protein [Clostridia bacterium]